MTSIVIYEDNSRLRQSMELLLNDGSSFEVKASYDNCTHAEQDMATHRPDVVIMDIDMPGMSGIEGVGRVKACHPTAKVVMYTVFDDDDRIFESICNGADGYLLKNTPPLKLMQSLGELIEGNTPMSPFVAQKVFNHFRQKTTKTDYQLTQREKEILELLVEGNSYKMIAGKTNISTETVKKHLQNIYHKLHVSCATEAVAKALKDRII
jgi:DNA-binding NarL/FixJ family response regulator